MTNGIGFCNPPEDPGANKRAQAISAYGIETHHYPEILGEIYGHSKLTNKQISINNLPIIKRHRSISHILLDP